MGDRENWEEVDRALKDGSLYNADLRTLQRYLGFVSDPPPSTNVAFHARLVQAGETIRHLISQRENELHEQSQAIWEQTAHKENQTQLARSLLWGKIAAWAAIIGAFAAIVGVCLMLVQLFWFTGK